MAQTHHADDWHQDAVSDFFLHRGLSHIRTRRRGALITAESGPNRATIPHARFRRDTVHLWLLEMPTHSGKWQRTPFRAPLRELLDLVVENFSWTLAPIAENPERTSDLGY